MSDYTPFEHDTFGRFTIVSRPTVRQILAYKGAIGWATGSTFYSRFWEGVKPLIDDWNCKAVPDYRTFDLDKSEDFGAANTIMWACDVVAGYMTTLELTPKNS